MMNNVDLPSEISYVNHHPDAQIRLKRFYMLWTRKEALMKAEGLGFSLPPLSFSVPLEPRYVENEHYSWETFELNDTYIVSAAVKKEEGVQVDIKIRQVLWEDLMNRKVN